MSEPMTTMTIRIDRDLKAQVEKAAKGEDRTVTSYVTAAIRFRLATSPAGLAVDFKKRKARRR